MWGRKVLQHFDDYHYTGWHWLCGDSLKMFVVPSANRFSTPRVPFWLLTYKDYSYINCRNTRIYGHLIRWPEIRIHSSGFWVSFSLICNEMKARKFMSRKKQGWGEGGFLCSHDSFSWTEVCVCGCRVGAMRRGATTRMASQSKISFWRWRCNKLPSTTVITSLHDSCSRAIDGVRIISIA